MIFHYAKRHQDFYLSIVNDNGSELFSCLCIVKGSTCFADLDQQRLPLGEVFAQTVVDVLSLHVPQALVLQPHLERHSKRNGGENVEFLYLSSFKLQCKC